MKPLPSTKTSPDEGGNQACRSTHQWLNARWPRPIGRPPKPLLDQGEEEETNIPDQRGYLLAPLPGDRARRPSVQNLYMAAKTKLKLFEGTSLRPFTERTTGTPPSFPANIKELLHEELSANNETKPRRSASTRPRTSTKICCGSTVKRSGATVGDVTPGYP